MRNTNSIRAVGTVGMFSASLWLVALFIEYGFGLQPPGSGALFGANQTMFFVAEVCWVVAILGLMRVRAAGEGLFGRISLGLFAFGWAVLATALGVSLIPGAPAMDFLLPVGGLVSTLGGLLAGIAVAAAGRWHGWRRFAPLSQGLYYSLVLFLPLFFGQEPTLLTESLWTGTWFLTGLALFTNARDASDRRPSAEYGSDTPRRTAGQMPEGSGPLRVPK